MFNPGPSVPDLSSLFSLSCLSHYRRSSLSFVIPHGRSSSTFLRPLAPRALPRFLATTNALTPLGRFFGPCGHERRSDPEGSPCLSRPHFQPFCSQPLHHPSPGISVRPRFILLGSASHWTLWLSATEGCPPLQVVTGASHSARRLASRCSRIGFTLCCSHCYGRVVHLRQLPTPCCHDAVAFGYRRVNVPPDGDFHPAVCTPSQAHERRHLVGFGPANHRACEQNEKPATSRRRKAGSKPALPSGSGAQSANFLFGEFSPWGEG